MGEGGEARGTDTNERVLGLGQEIVLFIMMANLWEGIEPLWRQTSVEGHRPQGLEAAVSIRHQAKKITSDGGAHRR